MLENLRSAIMRALFGAGVGSEIANRGINWLSSQTREAIARDPQPVTQARLEPGETYTVIARPKPTRTERKLANRQAGLAGAEKKLSRPTTKQKRSARKLQKLQRRMQRTRRGSRKYRRLAAREARAGARFDRLMAPGRKLRFVRRELGATETELDLLRSQSFRRARRNLLGSSTRTETTVYS